MIRYHLFYVRRYEPNTYHFMGDAMRDELVPILSLEDEHDTTQRCKWLSLPAKSPEEAVKKFIDYQNENVVGLGPGEYMAVPVAEVTMIEYEGETVEGECWELE